MRTNIQDEPKKIYAILGNKLHAKDEGRNFT